MRPFFIFVILFSVLTACSSPQATVTRSAEVTVTLPPLTVTLIPTPTIVPAFLTIQEQAAAANENFTIMDNGSIEAKLPDGSIGPILGITLNPDGTSYTITVDGKPVSISADEVSISDANGLNVNGYEDVDGDGVFEKITAYTPDLIKQMNNKDIIAAAPEVEGLEKFISPAGKHIVLYRNEAGKYVQAKNLITNEVFADLIHISSDPENPTPITMDDLTSGRLADSERLQCPGFSDKVIPGDWRYVKGDSVSSEVRMNYDARYSDPSTRPQKMCSYSEVVTDLGRGEQTYIVMGLAIKNIDGSIGFVHRWGRPEDLQSFLEIEDLQFMITVDEIKHWSGWPEGEFLDQTRPEVESWAKEFEEADILPEEFEKRLFTLSAGKWQ